MRDPDELYEVDSDVPELAGAVLLHHFDGFIDAGSAGKLVADHLRARLESRVVARFDVDRLIDYRSRRPPMTYAGDHWEHYQDPELAVRLLHDVEGTPFLLLTGPEPDHEWELFVAAVRNLIERWELRLTVGMHGIPMGVPHTRPLGVIGHATRRDLLGETRDVLNRLQVPGSVAGLLEYRLGQDGKDAAGFAAHVPHYLAQSEYPAAALPLWAEICRVAGLVVPDDALREAARRTDLEVDRQVSASDEVMGVVRALEEQYDSFAAANEGQNLGLGSVDPVPTADELGAQFERFLAEQQDRSD